MSFGILLKFSLLKTQFSRSKFEAIEHDKPHCKIQSSSSHEHPRDAFHPRNMYISALSPTGRFARKRYVLGNGTALTNRQPLVTKTEL